MNRTTTNDDEDEDDFVMAWCPIRDMGNSPQSLVSK